MSKEKCLDANDYPIYVTNYTCTTADPSGKLLREASKSFFSGHSSFSFYCATFLIAFLHARLSGRLTQENTDAEAHKAQRWLRISFRGLRVIRPFLQFGTFALAFFICLTRVSDYKHHPTDVIAGALIGIIYALILLMFVIKLFENPVVFHFRGNQVHYLAEEGVGNEFKAKTTDDNSALSSKHFPLKEVPR